MVETKDIGNIAIGLTIALIAIAYVAPIGIEAIFGVDYRGWGWEHEDGESYEYNASAETWYKYNVTSDAFDIAAGDREDKKTSGLMKLVPLFAVLVIAIGVIMLVKKYTE